MLRIAPTRLVRLQVGVDAGVERQRLGGLELPLGALGLAGGDRIDARVQEFAAFQGAGPRLVDAHHVDRTEPHVAGLAAALVAEQPRLAAAVDLQIQPAAVAIAPITARAADGQCCELVDRPCHFVLGRPLTLPLTPKTSSSRGWRRSAVDRNSPKMPRFSRVLTGSRGRRRTAPDTVLAERVGFEPTVDLRPRRFSSPLL